MQIFRSLRFWAFLATFASTGFAGYNLAVKLAPDASLNWLSGMPYALSLMFILGCHEMGHFLVAKWWGLQKVSLPFFIPMPFTFLGTFGALIVIKEPYQNRKALFDVAIAGPWAGILATAALWLFLDPHSSLLFLGQIQFAIGIGIILTFLNLFPFGQLDGGHVFYALTSRIDRVRWLALLCAVTLYGVFVQRTVVPITLLAMLMFAGGIKHPPTQDDTIPLGRGRKALAMLTVALFVLLDIIGRQITIFK